MLHVLLGLGQVDRVQTLDHILHKVVKHIDLTGHAPGSKWGTLVVYLKRVAHRQARQRELPTTT